MNFLKKLLILFLFIISCSNTSSAINLHDLRNYINILQVLSSDNNDYYIDKKSTKQINSGSDDTTIRSIVYIVNYDNAEIYEIHIDYTYNPFLSYYQLAKEKTPPNNLISQKIIDEILEEKKVVSGITSQTIREIVYSFDGRVLFSETLPKTLRFDKFGTPSYLLGDKIYSIIFNITYDNIYDAI